MSKSHAYPYVIHSIRDTLLTLLLSLESHDSERTHCLHRDSHLVKFPTTSLKALFSTYWPTCITCNQGEAVNSNIFTGAFLCVYHRATGVDKQWLPEDIHHNLIKDEFKYNENKPTVFLLSQMSHHSTNNIFGVWDYFLHWSYWS